MNPAHGLAPTDDPHLSFESRVVVITGAGGGLGEAYALEFARRGARVVVNDLDGTAAARVAQSIGNEGGLALANSDSVVNGERIIDAALDAYGKVDVLINNAGILHDRAFHNLTHSDWKEVVDVNLEGSFRVTRAAWPQMRKAGYGRVIFTTSAAGIYGNFGQANYAAAKLGLVGLGQTLAIEGRSKGIKVNMIAPVAASRLTQTVLPAEVLRLLKPELVTPLVVLLTHESCQESGQLFEIGGGWISRLRWERSEGYSFPRGAFTAEHLAQSWAKVQSFENATHPMDASQTFEVIGRNLGIDFGLQLQTPATDQPAGDPAA